MSSFHNGNMLLQEKMSLSHQFIVGLPNSPLVLPANERKSSL